ncbi:hypothetical protein ABW20_dc0103030 [Dactylellina cionopaga]|nr:hypothetical protein ABW20_dc0103030 [Dactylellina cionopaga]
MSSPPGHRFGAQGDRPSILTVSDPNIKNFIPARPTEPTVFDPNLTSSPIFEFVESDFELLYPPDRHEDGSIKEPVKPNKTNICFRVSKIKWT